MADINFYKYLEEAFRYKLFNPAGKRATFDTRYNYLGYNLTYDKIFFYARKILPKFYTSEFPDTQEGNLQLAKKVLEKLDKHQDIPLKNQFNGVTVSEKDSQIIADAKTESQAESQQVPPVESQGAPFGLPSIPTVSTTAQSPRIIYNAPQTPKPEIVIANKSGVVVEPPSKEAQLVTANKSGVVAETPPSKIYIANKSGTVIGERPIAPRRFNFSSIKSSFPSFFKGSKNFGSRAGVFFQRNAGKYFTVGRIATAASAGIGAFTGAALTNGHPMGIFGGGIGGAVLPSWLKSKEGTRFFARLGNGVINAGARFSNLASRGGTKLSVPSGSKKLAGGLIGFLIFFVIIGGAIGALTGGTNPTGGTTSPGGTATLTDISSCKFTRAGSSAPIKSKTLQNWIAEIASKEGIPVAIMASVTMHENPRFVSDADDNHDAIKNNYYYIVSRLNDGLNKDTNAIGLFQISTGQTPTNRGIVDHCDTLLDTGILSRAAAKLGKKVQDKSYYCVADFEERIKRLCQTNRVERNKAYYQPDQTYDSTYINLCNLQDNIAVGAEFLKSTLGNGSWDNPENLKNAITGFYGGCSYPGGDYCTEVATDYQNCKPTTTTPATAGQLPVAPNIDTSNLRQSIIDKFGITMNGYDNDHLKWVWEKLWEVSNTNFIKFVRGSVIVADSDSRQINCPGAAVAVYLNPYPEALFKYGLIHELGHVVRNCGQSSGNFYAEHLRAHNKEGGVTYYANNAPKCTGSDDISEDYAEMIALYLNPNANIQMVKCATDAGITKYTNLKNEFPLHYNVAKSVLGDF